jgi:signal transduction histidine kinase
MFDTVHSAHPNCPTDYGEETQLARGGASLHVRDAEMASAPAAWGCVLDQPVSADERLQQLERALRESRTHAAAGQFAIAMMHAINDPLEAISNLNYLVQASSVDELQVSYYSALLEKQLRILARIARQTRSFYLSGETTQASEIGLLLEAALHMHRRNIDGKKIRLIKRLPEDVIAEIHPVAMLQVFASLLENALEALPDRGTLCVRLRRTNGKAHILVADNGHGIPDGIRLRVFDFFTTTKDQGQGFGLPVAKAIVERYRGMIRSRTSTLDGRNGTTFRISLPLRDYQAPAYVG